MDENKFNQTMQGYVNLSLDGLRRSLQLIGYDDDAIDKIKDIFLEELKWAKDTMTLEQARVYQRKF